MRRSTSPARTQDRPLRAIDLFCGAGGLSLGFHAAGCRIAAAVDVDARAGTSFRRNFTILQPEHPPQVLASPHYSLDRLGIEDIPIRESPAILIGGPPCQAFSRLGRGKLDSLSDEGFVGDPRNQLHRAFLAAVQENPRHVPSFIGLIEAYEAAADEYGDPDLLDQASRVCRDALDLTLEGEQSAFLEAASSRLAARLAEIRESSGDD